MNFSEQIYNLYNNNCWVIKNCTNFKLLHKTAIQVYLNKLLNVRICKIILCLIYIYGQQTFVPLSLMSIALCCYLNIYEKIRRHECRSTKVCLHHRHAVPCHEQSCHILLLKLNSAHFETNKILAFISVRRLFLSEGYYLAPLIIRDLPSNIHLTSFFVFVLMSTIFSYALNEVSSSPSPSQ